MIPLLILLGIVAATTLAASVNTALAVSHSMSRAALIAGPIRVQ